MGWIQERRRTSNREREAPQRKKGMLFRLAAGGDIIGSERRHEWQRPLPTEIDK